MDRTLSKLENLKVTWEPFVENIHKNIINVSKEEIEGIPVSRVMLGDHKHVYQAWFSRVVDGFEWEQLFHESSLSARARLLSLSSKGAQAWMQATPQKGLYMPSISVLVACRRVLGLPLPFARPLPASTHCRFCPSHPEIKSSATKLHNRLNREVLSMHSECGRYASSNVTTWFDHKPYPDGIVYGRGRHDCGYFYPHSIERSWHRQQRRLVMPRA